MKLPATMLASALAIAPMAARAADVPCDQRAWRFGMTPEQVRAITACGPYSSFGNGDLETGKGVFDGKARNVQFFFQAARLRRIGVYFYEGPDVQAAAAAYIDLYRSLSRNFGRIQTPGYAAPVPGDADGERAEVARFARLVASDGRVQMAPDTPPTDAFAFASLKRQRVDGHDLYYVALFFDPPGGTRAP